MNKINDTAAPAASQPCPLLMTPWCRNTDGVYVVENSELLLTCCGVTRQAAFMWKSRELFATERACTAIITGFNKYVAPFLSCFDAHFVAAMTAARDRAVVVLKRVATTGCGC